MTTWADCWNGVNHPATAPTAEDEVLLRGYLRYQRRCVLPRNLENCEKDPNNE